MDWFDIVDQDGRELAEAEGIDAARRAAIILCVENDGEPMAVHHAVTHELIGSVSIGPVGPMWRSSTLERRFQ
jgi:hypothetical protein